MNSNLFFLFLTTEENAAITRDLKRTKSDTSRTHVCSRLQDKEKLEAELKRVEDVAQERSVAIGNLKNELMTAQDQLKAYDAQMAKDREKLLKLREDKKILLDKVSAFLFSVVSEGGPLAS